MLAATTEQQREPFYEDILQMIRPGFLTCRVKANGMLLSLRSLYPSDLYLLRHWVDEDYEWRVWAVATSVWMIDGTPMFEFGRKAISEVAKVIRELPARVVNSLFKIALHLFHKSREVSSVLQSFLFEDASRRIWGSVNSNSPIDDSFLGIEGLSKLGMNYIQRVWVTWNRSEDRKEEDHYQWSITKANISAHAPKAARKMNARDKTSAREEKERRQRLQDEFYYVMRGILSEDGFVTDGEGNVQEIRLRGAQTPEELSDEMRRWVTGDEDFHDRVVSQYKNRIKTGMENRIQAREDSIQAARDEADRMDQLQGMATPRLVGYTPDQVKELLSNNNRGETGTRKIYAVSITEKQDRWLKTSPPPAKGDNLLRRGPQSPTTPDLNQVLSKRIPHAD